ncbi:unnamed protein product [Acanthoscelides obtectus]|uniref:LIN-9 C-terminal domain-containing protein n=1 Tax=Acanthoscelides obtectus TaxID=200917 RepID=A0A9P0PRP4_ACAOB|nr:unnamed protein product [Acanthoscelides obtectus]CAK1620677.1 hypothetical protein AOBTE_LOCUS501 [Acanthoscelides obtectus]
MVLGTKILNLKRRKLHQLSDLNSEQIHFSDQEIPAEFERRSASVLIALEKLNFDLRMYLDEMQINCQEREHKEKIESSYLTTNVRYSKLYETTERKKKTYKKQYSIELIKNDT